MKKLALVVGVVAMAVLGPQSAEAQLLPNSEQVDQHVIDLAIRFEQAIQHGDVEAARQCIDLSALAARASENEEFNGTLYNHLLDHFTLLDGLVANAAAPAHYDLLRIRRREEGLCATYRFVSSNYGINYNDLLFASKAGHDGLRFVDIYVHASGEWHSETVRRLLEPELDLPSRSQSPRIQQLGEFATAINDGRWRDALDIYDSLPPSLREDKSTLVARAFAAINNENNQLIIEAVEQLRARYPDDSATVLFSLDYWFYTEKWDAMIEGISKLHRAVGVDPFLNLYEANAYKEKGDLEWAKQLLEVAIRFQPEFEAFWFNLVEVALEQRDFETVARALTVLVHDFTYEFSFEGVDVYAEFLESPEYEQWTKDVVRIEAIASEDTAWLEEMRLDAARIVEYYIADYNAGQPITAEILDEAFGLYMIDDAPGQPEPRQVIWAFGTVLGDLVAAKGGLEWCIYTDAGNYRVIAIAAPDEVVFPFVELANRIDGSDDTFLIEFINEWTPSVPPAAAADTAGEKMEEALDEESP